ncbi:MAG TPA: 1,4-alpha-glucan branching protein GlgB [Vicinamibacterales bacterium]|jgi:1,4-alpha-glucan branching enzyme|nr:1,4-alpha-glucan branching protein GlgB [Vicinamibacterales bacterium]
MTSVAGAALDALAQARHGDPFSLLGPHRSEKGIVIRTYQPAAEHVTVVRDGRLAPMARVHPSGIFEAQFDDAPEVFDYRFRIRYPGGHAVETDDPYRYGRVISDYDLYLFGEGKHTRIYDRLGAHPMRIGNADGVHFAAWAPNAERVSVVGDFNGWDGRLHPMRLLGMSGVWEIFIPGVREGQRYKFELRARQRGELLLKSDPYGFAFEVPPLSASIVARLEYAWGDDEWIRARAGLNNWFTRPFAAYEVHLGSWARVPGENNRYLTYREMADRLIPYVKEMGYTHIELLPVAEHPFSGSWGYQVTGYYAPTSRFGTPGDFKAFVDACHQHGLGVVLDWVPGHFPKDRFALAQFDGTSLYEHADPRQGEHRDWGTLIFNYGRNEVRNFLLANALFWLEEYHVDGLRVDAVASMLYLDYSRNPGEWVPNRHGGRENLDAIEFLRELNVLTHGEHPGSITIAEESTAFPSVSRPAYLGGLGFTYKWNMGWMNDILEYVRHDPVYRRYHQRHLTFSLLYAFSENFILPFSHDEVVHGKGSMFGKIPGDDWQKAATLRALYGFMYTHPGKKLMFMGCEFGQGREWNFDASLDWHLLDEPLHRGIRQYVRDLNGVYASQPAMYECDFDAAGFQWIDCNDSDNSVVSFIRRAANAEDFVVSVLNFTPVPREGYVLGVPRAGNYTELVNSDAAAYGGGNVGNGGVVFTEAIAAHGHPQSLRLTLPPLGCLILKPAAH